MSDSERDNTRPDDEGESETAGKPAQPTDPSEERDQAEDGFAVSESGVGSGVFVSLSADEYEQLRQAAAERDGYLDRLKRAMADYQNLQTRSSRLQQEAAERGVHEIAKELLPVVDNLALALKAAEETEDVGRLQEGLRLIDEQLHAILSKFDIRPLEAVGRPFDPAVHDAMAQEPSDAHPQNTVLREFQKGYIQGDRVLRPARVIVSTKPPESVAKDGEDRSNT